ncbi:MAG: PspC domain-containing protein [Myxococcales bacterium]|nr:PspC domain-containing protein [Myxococcales bacterium]
MNKILHINISGQIIAIQAPAYEVLQAYLASLRQHFAAEEGSEEIINDIEGRIAEMLSEKIRGGLPAIDIEAVNAVANTMGHPADFARDAGEDMGGVRDRQAAGQGDAAGGAGAAASTAAYGADPSPSPKRLYRDSKDRWIGGVCSGIANYLNVDTTLVRFLFAVISFGGFGLGFLIYLALWILLPEKDLEDGSGSRLFRNPDDKILGGVCSGIAAYLGKEPKLVRWVFSAPLIINAFIAFGAWMLFLFSDSSAPALISSSLVSTMVFAYVVLWIVLPEAGTPYDKMRMRREAVDINAIKQRVQAGLAVAKQRMVAVGDEVRTRSQQWQAQNGWGANSGAAGAAGDGDVEDAQYVAGTGSAMPGVVVAARRHPVSTGIGHAIRVLFQVFFLFIAGVMAFSLFVTLFALAIGSAAWWPLRDYLWSSAWQETLAWATAVLFFLVPALGFVIWLFRRVVGAGRNAALGWTFGGLWALGWVSATLFAVNISGDLRTYEHVEQQLTAPPLAPTDVMRLTVSQPRPTYNNWWVQGDLNGWDVDEQTMKLSIVRVSFRKSAGDGYAVAVRKFAAGTSEAAAKARAEKTQYQATWQGDTLDLGSHFLITPTEKFRGQNIEVVVDVPVGRQVRVDASVGEKLAFGDAETWHADWPGEARGDAHGHAHGEWHGKGLPDGEEPNEFLYDFELVPDTNYVMGSDGKLRPSPVALPAGEPAAAKPVVDAAAAQIPAASPVAVPADVAPELRLTGPKPPTAPTRPAPKRTPTRRAPARDDRIETLDLSTRE